MPFEIRRTGFDVLLAEVELVDESVTRTRLVLVEDDPDNLDVFSLILAEKYALFGYASVAEALDAIDAVKPDVVVLDIGMQPVDGVQCLEMIRAMPGYRDVPAVALTGFARDAERQSFLDRGFQAVVPKPIFDPDELIAVIDSLRKSPAPASPQALGHQRPSSGLPSVSLAAQLDGEAGISAPTAGGSPKTDGPGPA